MYGDDSTTVQDAPTSGKFYVRLDKGDSSVLWGNFQTQMTGTDFIQYARTLYGLDIRYRSPETTSLGEKKRSVDAFWADPGTLESRQEFRGTGGSLYYLQNQDISVGSEQVWMQVRDKDSGIVQSVTPIGADPGLRHQLSAGPHPAAQPAVGDRERRDAGAQRAASTAIRFIWS